MPFRICIHFPSHIHTDLNMNNSKIENHLAIYSIQNNFTRKHSFWHFCIHSKFYFFIEVYAQNVKQQTATQAITLKETEQN